MGDFPFLDHLSLKYMNVAEKTEHWTDYLKAHGLLNACLARDPSREDVKRKIYYLESGWYGSHPKTYSEHQQRIADLKSQLKKLRDKTEQKLDALEPMQASLSTDTILSRENIIRLLNFSNGVFKMSSECTASLVEFSKSVILSSMNLLDEPPCSFAVIGLGSLARGEATPYSDLEYGFIVESGFSQDKYFTDLAVESYFCIGNLGESPLKCFFIEELNVKDDKGEKLFVDQPLVNGFKIDGISPKAGNIPTGHGTDGGKRLILTVDELMTLYKSSLMAPADPDVPGDMSDLLFSPVLIHEHKGGEKFLEQFIAKRKVYESSFASYSQQAKNKRLGTIVSDIKNHPFIPEFIFGDNTEHNVQVKYDIFRYPTLLATNLKIISNIDTKYPWDTFQWFYEKQSLSAGNLAYLTIMLGLSIFIRTKAYIALGSQYEELSLQPTVTISEDISDRFHVPQNIFLTLGCLLAPIKRCIERSIVKARTVYSELQGFDICDIIHSMLKDFQIFDEFLLKAEVLSFMGNFKKASEVITSAIGESCVCEAMKFREAVLKEYPDQQSDRFVNKSLQMMASILIGLDRHEVALDYLSWLAFNSQSDIERIRWDIQSVQSLMILEKYQSVESQLRQIEIRLRNILSVEVSEPLHAHVISLLKCGGQSKSRMNSALFLSCFVFQMYALYSKARKGLELYQQALEDLTHAEDIVDVLSDIVDTRDDLIRLFISKGDLSAHMRKYDASEVMYRQAIALCKSVYGSHAATHEISASYHNLSTLYTLMGKYSQADQLEQKALEIMDKMFGNDHLTSLNAKSLLGSIWFYQGKYIDALKLFGHCINFHPISKIIETSYDDVVCEIYHCLGEYASAYNFLSAAGSLDTPLGLLVMSSYDTSLYTQHMPSVMRWLGKVMTAEPIEVKTMSSQGIRIRIQVLLHFGEICMNINRWSEALEYLSAALPESKLVSIFYYQKTMLFISEAHKRLEQYRTSVQFSNLVLISEGETSDRHTGEAHYIIGDCYMRLGLYKKSWSHLHSALCLYQNMPKFRSFVLMLAKIHLSVAKLLFKLCRVSESLEHAMKSAQLTDGLISDQEKTNRESAGINEQALMFICLTLSTGCLFDETQSTMFRTLGTKRRRIC